MQKRNGQSPGVERMFAPERDPQSDRDLRRRGRAGVRLGAAHYNNNSDRQLQERAIARLKV